MRNKALSGKRIVCLGGTSGIGLATAKAAQREGAKILIASSKRQRVDSSIKSLRGDAEGFVVDLLDETLVQDLFKRIGSFDHLVYTAGETLQLDMLDALQIDRAREFRSCCCSQAGKSGGSCNRMRNQSPRRARTRSGGLPGARDRPMLARMRLMCCCMALLAALTTDSWAATRAYVMNGLFVGTGLATITWRLRERGYIVAYGSYRQDRAFAADACAHPADRIIVIGHSFGAEAAARVATLAAACGARDVTMIGVDPAAPSQVRGVSHAVNFVGEYRGTIVGAQNIPVPGYTHMGIMESPAVQERILSEAK